MKKIILFLYLLVIGAYFFKAVAQQDVPYERKNFTAFTPNTYAFSKVNNIPTSYFTGQIKPSIPLYEKQMSVLNFTMSTDFIAGGGIKVDDPGSVIGRGWMLNTGGIIVRNLMGIADDYNNVTVNSGRTGPPDKKYNGMAYTPGLAQIADGDARNDNAWTYFRGESDSEHDIFEYNFCGRNGKFYIGKDKQILISDDSKIKIIPDFTNSNMLGSNLRAFTIIDESGIKYYFETPEVSQNTSQDPVNQEGIFYFKDYASSWLLTKIEAPGGQETIVFDYYKRAVTQYYSVANFYRFSRRTKAYDPSGFNYNWFFGGNFSSSENSTARLDIKSVTFSDGTKISFDYFLGRPDEPEAVIRFIEIKNDQEQLIKKYAFNYLFYNSDGKYRYINYTQAVPWPGMVYFPERYRMHLESIYLIGSGNKIQPQASFSYYLDNYMNEQVLFNYDDVDYWGYHNGKNNTGNLLLIPSLWKPAANRQPDINFARMGALKQIFYATGGSEEFEYELNDKWNGTANETVGGIRLKKRYLHDAVDSRNDIITEYKYTEPNGRSSGFLGDKPIFEYLVPHYTSGFPGSNPTWDYVDTVTTSNPVNSLSSVEGSPVGYRRVEEIFKNGTGTNGKRYTSTVTWRIQPFGPHKIIIPIHLFNVLPGRLACR